MAWHARLFEKGDEQGILELRRAVFGDMDPVRNDIKTWQWQFEKNPAGPGFIMLAKDAGKIVGQYAAIPTRMVVNGKKTIFGFSCDTMVHPDFQGQGIFVALASKLYAHIKATHNVENIWGFPNKNSMHGFISRLGWGRVGTYCAKITFPKIPALVKNPRGFECKNGVFARPIERFGPEFDELWDKHRPKSGVAQIRDSVYLNWRYFGVPAFKYRVFSIYAENQLTGYFVLRSLKFFGLSVAVLSDLFPLPIISSQTTCQIVSQIRKIAAQTGHLMLVGLFPSAHSSLAKKSGFWKIPEKFAPKVFHLAGRLDPGMDLKRPENWHISLGDTDVV